MNRRVGIFILAVLAFASCQKNDIGGVQPPPDGTTTTTPKPFVTYTLNEFSMGADLSYAVEMKARNFAYRDANVVTDVFEILKNHGCNTIRLRLFLDPVTCPSPPAQYTDSYAVLANVKASIQKAKDLGLAVNLDLHYSDCWADPGHQCTPDAWDHITDINELADTVYNYTTGVLQELATEGLVPEMIQIGNETSGGMLWPLGQVVGGNFANYATLVNAGIEAVRDFSASSAVKPKIILHCGKLDVVNYWAAKLLQAGVSDYDILGFSQYANYTSINDPTAIRDAVMSARTTFGKDVIATEAAYWWSDSDALNAATGLAPLAGYPFTKDGQHRYLKDFTQAVIDGGGKGVHYWAPDYRNTPWGGEIGARALFDFTGNTLPAIDFCRYAYDF